MLATLRATNPQPDAAPLWLPRHESLVVDQAAARPPDRVDGYGGKDLVVAAFLGSRWKNAATVATALAMLAFVAVLPALFGAGIVNLIKITFYQSWTLVLMLMVTARVRSVAIGSVVRYWLAGLFVTVILVHFLSGPLVSLAGTGDRSAVWVIPPLEEILKAVLLVVAVVMGRRVWRHPGLCDLMILGFAVGGGYAFYTDALWERAALSGFEANAGLFVPTINQPDGIFVVGHAVWTAILGFAIGLFLLHRRQAVAVVLAAVAALAVFGDHMASNDAEDTLGWIRQLLLHGKLVALIFLVAFAAAVLLDSRRLGTTASRDHLFPSDRGRRSQHVDPDSGDDIVLSFLLGRYRRRRNGVHTSVDATVQQWPPLSEAHPAPVAELARIGRAAGIAVGPGNSSTGWAPDPETPGSYRFVGPHGFTAYVAGAAPIAPAPIAPPRGLARRNAAADGTETGSTETGDTEAGDAEAGEVEAIDADTPSSQSDRPSMRDRIASVRNRMPSRTRTAVQPGDPLPTSTSASTPRARPDAAAVPASERPDDFWQYAGLTAVAVALYVLVRLLTAGEASTAVIELVSLPDAPNSPALIRTVLGALAAAVALRGRDAALLGPGWEVGPGDDPRPDRADECEA